MPNRLQAFFAAIIPGAGHWVRGEERAAFLWCLFIVTGYAALVLPGLFLHALSFLDVALRPIALPEPERYGELSVEIRWGPEE